MLTSTGHLVFGRSGRVFAARFNADREQIEGEPEPIASGVRMHALYPHLQLAVSSAGVMVYVPGGDVAVAGLAWVDRQNRAEFLRIEPGVYGMFDLSDDGRRLAIQVVDNRDYIVIYDVEQNTSRRLATPESAGWPKWSPSGRGAGLYELQRRKAVQNPDSTDRFGPPADRGCRSTLAAHDEHVDRRPLAAHVLRVSR